MKFKILESVDNFEEIKRSLDKAAKELAELNIKNDQDYMPEITQVLSDIFEDDDPGYFTWELSDRLDEVADYFNKSYDMIYSELTNSNYDPEGDKADDKIMMKKEEF